MGRQHALQSQEVLTERHAIVGGDPTPAKGSISAGGAARWTEIAQTDGAPVDATGTFRVNRGSGSYQRRDAKCGGRFTATGG